MGAILSFFRCPHFEDSGARLGAGFNAGGWSNCLKSRVRTGVQTLSRNVICCVTVCKSRTFRVALTVCHHVSAGTEEGVEPRRRYHKADPEPEPRTCRVASPRSCVSGDPDFRKETIQRLDLSWQVIMSDTLYEAIFSDLDSLLAAVNMGFSIVLNSVDVPDDERAIVFSHMAFVLHNIQCALSKII